MITPGALLLVAAAAAAWTAPDDPRTGQPAAAELVEVRRIWDGAPHNAFTDLVRFGDRWLCVFREGEGHVSPDGAIRVIASNDGRDWKSLARLALPGADLRDPKISRTPAGKLMIVAAAARDRQPDGNAGHQSMTWFSPDGQNWDGGHDVGDLDYWLWRVIWNPEKAYGVGYGCTPKNKTVRLYGSTDGIRFETLVATLSEGGYPNETGLAFQPDGTMLCLLRRDEGSGSGLLGQSRPPYTTWTWKDLGARIGGPQILILPDGRVVAGVRLYDQKVRTSLAWVDPRAGTLREFLALPSGGDTSYPGLVWHDGLLWVSYYSSHEGKTNIYLAKVKLPAAP